MKNAVKTSTIIFVIALTVNLVEAALSPFIILATVFGAPTNALRWTLLILEFAVWCGTAITANIIAGQKIKTRWYATALPSVFTLAMCFFLCSPLDGKFWFVLLAGILLIAATCVAPLLISAYCYRKKTSMQETATEATTVQAEEANKTSKENNETI